jgi:hypothetical protein
MAKYPALSLMAGFLTNYIYLLIAQFNFSFYALFGYFLATLCGRAQSFIAYHFTAFL